MIIFDDVFVHMRNIFVYVSLYYYSWMICIFVYMCDTFYVFVYSVTSFVLMKIQYMYQYVCVIHIFKCEPLV